MYMDSEQRNGFLIRKLNSLQFRSEQISLPVPCSRNGMETDGTSPRSQANLFNLNVTKVVICIICNYLTYNITLNTQKY